MGDTPTDTRWLRRAQPLLGTLVEIGVRGGDWSRQAAVDAAFGAVREVQSHLSRFEPLSDVARFNAIHRGEWLTMQPDTQHVLAAAQELRRLSHSAFDISLGSAPEGWRCEGARLYKLDDAAQIDLGGIGKGHAVDRAVRVLIERGVQAGWVNAGGDLRAFGAADVPVRLRDEARGGTRAFASLRDGAFATSHYDRCTRSQLAAMRPVRVHVSVAAPLCLWADALTKVVALSGDTAHPLLARFEACAWLH